MAEHINKALKRQGDRILASTESYVSVTPGHIKRAQQAWEKHDMKEFTRRVSNPRVRRALKLDKEAFLGQPVPDVDSHHSKQTKGVSAWPLK